MVVVRAVSVGYCMQVPVIVFVLPAAAWYMYHNNNLKGEHTMARFLHMQPGKTEGKYIPVITNQRVEGQCWELEEGGIIHDTVTPAAEVRLQSQLNAVQEAQSGMQESQAITDQAVQDLIITTMGGAV